MPGVIEMLVAPVTCQHSLEELPASIVDGVTTNTTIWGTEPLATVMVTGAVTVLPSLEVATYTLSATSSAGKTLNARHRDGEGGGYGLAVAGGSRQRVGGRLRRRHRGAAVQSYRAHAADRNRCRAGSGPTERRLLTRLN